MAQSVVINSVVYSDVPQVQIPKQGGGTATFYDTSGASSVSASDVLSGVTVYGASGEVVGSMTNNGGTGGTIGTVNGTYTIPSGYTSGGTVSLTNVSDCQAANILSGKSILGVSGSLSMVSVSQDGTTKVLSIS
jgi:hypothetical protein